MRWPAPSRTCRRRSCWKICARYIRMAWCMRAMRIWPAWSGMSLCRSRKRSLGNEKNYPRSFQTPSPRCRGGPRSKAVASRDDLCCLKTRLRQRRRSPPRNGMILKAPPPKPHPARASDALPKSAATIPVPAEAARSTKSVALGNKNFTAARQPATTTRMKPGAGAKATE